MRALTLFLTPLLLALNAQAALHDRGNGLIYDDVLDITWLQDANYARTSGWAADNYVAPDDEDWTGYGDEVQLNGRSGQSYASPWVDTLVYGGYDDWRLPSTRGSTDPDCSDDCEPTDLTLGELGHMFFNNLGNTDVFDPSCLSDGGCQGHNTSFLDAATNTEKYFSNVMASYFYQPEPFTQWSFNMSDGSVSGVAGHNLPTAWVWAVRDGDVHVAPEIDGAIAPLALALIAGIVAIRRERRQPRTGR